MLKRVQCRMHVIFTYYEKVFVHSILFTDLLLNQCKHAKYLSAGRSRLLLLLLLSVFCDVDLRVHVWCSEETTTTATTLKLLKLAQCETTQFGGLSSPLRTSTLCEYESASNDTSRDAESGASHVNSIQLVTPKFAREEPNPPSLKVRFFAGLLVDPFGRAFVALRGICWLLLPLSVSTASVQKI